MGDTIDLLEAAENQGFFDLFGQIEAEHGLAVLLLILIILGMALLLWKLVWRVWRATLTSKNDEIDRLVDERNKYQDMVFEGLKTSRFDPRLENPRDNGEENNKDNDKE